MRTPVKIMKKRDNHGVVYLTVFSISGAFIVAWVTMA